jgi:hypothetical protein
MIVSHPARKKINSNRENSYHAILDPMIPPRKMSSYNLSATYRQAASSLSNSYEKVLISGDIIGGENSSMSFRTMKFNI